MTQEEGLTGDEYKEMTEKQDETCENCGQEREKHYSYLEYCSEAEFEDFQESEPRFKLKPKNHSQQDESLTTFEGSVKCKPAGTHSPHTRVIDSGSENTPSENIVETPLKNQKTESEGTQTLNEIIKEWKEKMRLNHYAFSKDSRSVRIINQLLEEMERGVKNFIKLLKEGASLSEKIKELKHDTNNADFLAGDDFIRVIHIKNFIKELKDYVEGNFIGDKPKLITVDNVLYYIDKLAGDDLI